MNTTTQTIDLDDIFGDACKTPAPKPVVGYLEPAANILDDVIENGAYQLGGQEGWTLESATDAIYDEFYQIPLPKGTVDSVTFMLYDAEITGPLESVARTLVARIVGELSKRGQR